MRILQLDVDRISYELVKPEARIHEDGTEKNVDVKDALVLLVSVEQGDDKTIAEHAIADATKFMERMKKRKMVIYPFAHLSSSLASQELAMELVQHMGQEASKSFEVTRAPFGWNKKLSLEIKGHPLAEQSRRYPKETDVSTASAEAKKNVNPKRVDTSIVRKSDVSGLPATDHRTIGEAMDLFSFQEVSPGMVYWHNNGLIIFRQLQAFIREKLAAYGYSEVSTPTLANVALWHVSGHIDHYRDNMFMLNSEDEQLGMKPMNCPSTILIYKSRSWSYRELPFRAAIFDKLYRNEISGALTGLFRVRELTQDDGHIFARNDQIGEEITSLLKLLGEVYKAIGVEYSAKLSTMPDEHMGDEKLWEDAEAQLKKALETNGIKYTINEKDGAFYGPKIDVDIVDSMGRKWQCGTIQIDYQLPIRFGLEYANSDGKMARPVMIHRAILGSFERFIGILIEHYQGKFPTWLAPVQVRVISISEPSNEYAHSVHEKLKESGMRAYADLSDRTLEYKIRDAQVQKVPYMLVIGKKEQEAETITVRHRSGKQEHNVKLQDFISMIGQSIRDRTVSD